jgi:hypothetical protein
VAQQLVNGDVFLAVLAELRHIVADRVEQVELLALIQQVDRHRRHRLAGGVKAHRCFRRHRHGGVIPIPRAVAPGVADRPFQNDLSVAAQGERQARMHTGGVHVFRRPPDGGYAGVRHPDGLGLDFVVGGDSGDRRQVSRDLC